jgi:carbon monoxide dehydrogenase subunit G
MKMSDEIRLPVAQEVAWNALNDVNLLKTCIPGCEAINLQEDGSYELVVAAAVGPIRARFKGEMRMHDIVAPSAYRLEFNMQGGAVGFGRGGASVELSAIDETTTLLKYTASANVGGKLAQIGARLIDITAKKMAGQFFEAFRKKLTAGSEAQADESAADPQASQARPSNPDRAPVSVAGRSAGAAAVSSSEAPIVIKIEVTINDQTSSRRGSRWARCWDALMGR